MAGRGDGGADAGKRRPNADISPGGTLLESDSEDGAGAEQRRSWRPSRPPLSGEYAPFSATGVQSGRPARRTRSRIAWLVAGVGVLAALGSVWMLDGSRGQPAPPVAPVVQVVPVTPAQPASAEPRVTPIVQAVQKTSASSPDAVPVAPASVEVRAQALQPMPRAKPESASSSVASAFDQRSSAPAAHDEADVAEPSLEAPGGLDQTAPAVPRVSVPARAAPGRSDDPWDPDSFGDRH